MNKTAVFAHLVAKEEHLADVQSQLERLVVSTTDEDGTMQYVLSQDSADATSFWFFEVYVDDDAFQAHMGSDAMANALVTLDGKLAAPPELHVVRPVKAKGLDL